MFVIFGWILGMGAVFGVFIAHGGNIAVVLKATMKCLAECFKASEYTKARYMELTALLYDILQPGGARVQGDLATIVELMRRVDKEEPIDRLEDTIKQDPTLAFKLLHYLNSAAFALRVEVSSFRHALVLLGCVRLKRWLALLLASASKDRDMKPVMFAALRRGLLMEELARASADGGSDETCNEAFICGVFPLLDRMMKQPLAELLNSVPVAESVRQALVDGQGPYRPFLEIVRALENESAYDVRDCAERVLMGVGEINRAVLRVLAKAVQIQ